MRKQLPLSAESSIWQPAVPVLRKSVRRFRTKKCWFRLHTKNGIIPKLPETIRTTTPIGGIRPPWPIFLTGRNTSAIQCYVKVSVRTSSWKSAVLQPRKKGLYSKTLMRLSSTKKHGIKHNVCARGIRKTSERNILTPSSRDGILRRLWLPNELFQPRIQTSGFWCSVWFGFFMAVQQIP